MIAEILQITSDKRAYKVYVRCPFCGAQHVHGGGLIKTPLQLGERLSLCKRGTYEMVRIPRQVDNKEQVTVSFQ